MFTDCVKLTLPIHVGKQNLGKTGIYHQILTITEICYKVIFYYVYLFVIYHYIHNSIHLKQLVFTEVNKLSHEV